MQSDPENPLRTVHRRSFLRGAGAVVALPWLESVAGAKEIMRGRMPAITNVATNAGVTATGAPIRMACLSIPNGVNLDFWRPKKEGSGADFELNTAFESFSELKDKMQIIRGLDLIPATSGKDGGGDHARANASFLTACRAFKTSGSNVRLGPSVDQIAAQALGDRTRFRSLQLGVEQARNVGSCDTGYACAYQYNLSWASDTQPLAPEPNPRAVFEKLFGAGTPAEREANYQRRQARRKSILDVVMDDAKTLNKSLGRNDRRKLDQYLTSVREIEKQIERDDKFSLPAVDVARPDGPPTQHGDHLRLMLDLAVLAFETDSTRIITLPFSHDGSNRSFFEIGVSEGHHALSHHRGDEDSKAKLRVIDKFYCDVLAYFLNKMESVKDVDGKSMLDNSMVLYGGGIADGDRHSHHDLPIVLAGNAGGALSPGRAWNAGDVSLGNLYVSMLDTMGVTPEFIGDSTGSVKL